VTTYPWNQVNDLQKQGDAHYSKFCTFSVFFDKMTEQDYSKQLAASLLQIKAIRLSPQKPFTWASGLLSPVYCDNRLLLSYPDLRKQALAGLQKLCDEFGEIQGVAGVATAGIPHGMLLADRLNLPFVYVRSQPKGHGKGNQIEGEIRPGCRLIVVEDLISTGGSSLLAVKALQDAGMVPLAVLALFTYGLPQSEQQFSAANVPLRTITDYASVLQVAQRNGSISQDEFDLMQTWYVDPHAWSEHQKALSSNS
jgi:orotate phosphoribosyltransferase